MIAGLRRTLHPRPPRGRGFFAPLAAALALAAPAGAQEHAHHTAERPWGIGAQAIPLLTHASPAMAGESLTEAYLTQPAVMAHLRPWSGPLELSATLNLEGLTLRRGELNAGIWGEGYVDRRHPHTYLHEALATLRLPSPRGAGASLTVGKGFAPFGTDDPMVRPLVKYPANHHLAQILERLVAIAAVRAGPAVLEGALFNGNEPDRPEDLGSPERIGDSWSARLTLLPLPGMEAQASYAFLASPEFPAGSGIDHRKRSAALRWERDGHESGRTYVLLEWARTDESVGETRTFTFDTWLAEGSWSRGRVEAGLRLERTLRPEEERLEDPFRTPRPHTDVHLLGATRWHIASASLGLAGVEVGGVRMRPFAEGSFAHSRETLGSLVFDPAALYGSDRLWSLSAGVRVEAGSLHRRMGRYGAALPNPQENR